MQNHVHRVICSQNVHVKKSLISDQLEKSTNLAESKQFDFVLFQLI